MALSIPFRGSGEFVPVRVWSCPQHDEPQEHWCDCDHCILNGFTCKTCETAAWVDKIGEDGAVEMRELSIDEVHWRRLFVNDALLIGQKSVLLEEMLKRPASDPGKIIWVEDESL